MHYLRDFYLTTVADEEQYLHAQPLKCYDSCYPYRIFPPKKLEHIAFDDITIFYGGNGSGKTTLLNVIAEKTGCSRTAPFNHTDYFSHYLENCAFEAALPENRQFIASDDVFDYMLDVRTLNDGIDEKRAERMKEYFDLRYAQHRTQSLEDVNELRYLAKQKTLSKYIRQTVMDNVRTYSNGESAFRYFTQTVTEDGLYLLDEPENSLSPQNQLELVSFLTEAVRFYRCQLVIATHSPFVLSLPNARVYDLDAVPPRVRDWHELENMRMYWRFFTEQDEAFRRSDSNTGKQ